MTKTAIKYELVPKQKLDIPYLKIEQFKKAIILLSVYLWTWNILTNTLTKTPSTIDYCLVKVSLDFVTL